MLGGHAADRAALTELLGLVFQYGRSRNYFTSGESCGAFTVCGAGVLAAGGAGLCWSGTAQTSDRFKEIVTALKEGMELRGRELFHPIRLALAEGRGRGNWDRVILFIG